MQKTENRLPFLRNKSDMKKRELIKRKYFIEYKLFIKLKEKHLNKNHITDSERC